MEQVISPCSSFPQLNAIFRPKALNFKNEMFSKSGTTHVLSEVINKSLAVGNSLKPFKNSENTGIP